MVGMHLLISVLPPIEYDQDDVKLALTADLDALLDHVLGSPILCMAQLVQILDLLHGPLAAYLHFLCVLFVHVHSIIYIAKIKLLFNKCLYKQLMA